MPSRTGASRDEESNGSATATATNCRPADGARFHDESLVSRLRSGMANARVPSLQLFHILV